MMAIIIQVPLIGLLAGCATSSAMKTDDIPVPLRGTANSVVTLRAHAAGVQIYRCRADKDDAARVEWELKEPEADLFDPQILAHQRELLAEGDLFTAAEPDAERRNATSSRENP